MLHYTTTLALLLAAPAAAAAAMTDAESMSGCGGPARQVYGGADAPLLGLPGHGAAAEQERAGRRLQTGARIIVGGTPGWVVKPQSAPYDDIVANVGDTLVFTYSSSYHDVMLVDNDQCDFSQGQMVDQSGSFEWVIPSAGSWVFACTRGDHCATGQQQVRVTAGAAGPVDLGFTVADPTPCSTLLFPASIEMLEAAMVAAPVVMLGISNRGCTNAASARMSGDGTCNTFTEITDAQWAYLQCMHPQDRMCPTCGFSHSYIWIDGAYIGNGFAIRDMSVADMTQRLTDAGAATTCGGCDSYLAGAALTAAEVDAHIASNTVMLFGWEGCPCTGMARARFASAGICHEEFTWGSTAEPLMAYLNCRFPWAAGCPLRGSNGGGCSGNGEHHSFIFMGGDFIDNGFGFSEFVLGNTRLDALVTSSGAQTTCGLAPPTGSPVFTDFSHMLTYNPPKKNYGVSVTDVDGDGDFEMVVAGFANENLIYDWNDATSSFDSIAPPLIQDSSRSAIGVASCDIDGDGTEEIYVLNTDSYAGSTTTSDRLFKREADGTWYDMFERAENAAAASFIAGRSVACLDRAGDGTYGMFAANYGRVGNGRPAMPMKLYEVSPSTGALEDVAPTLGMDRTTGGRALISGAFVSPDGHSMDLFANNENGCNFLYRNEGGGNTFTEVAITAGVADCTNTGRGTIAMDANSDGVLDIVYGNWNGAHRMFLNDNDGTGHYTNAVTPEMEASSPIRTVIAADWDNNGQEELFWNNIPGDNRLFTRENDVWVPINIGDALEPTGRGTGAAYGDFNNDGCLELLISHGESANQPMTYYRPFNCMPPSQGGNHFLRIMPLTQFGAPARGATVRMSIAAAIDTAGEQTHIRNIDAGSGYLCQQEPVAHFGLGMATTVTEVTITWPSGDVLTIQGPAIDTMHRIPHPATGPGVPISVPGTPAAGLTGDITADGIVDVNDLLLMLGGYGNTGADAAVCDVVPDLVCDVNDLLQLLGNYGAGAGR